MQDLWLGHLIFILKALQSHCRVFSKGTVWLANHFGRKYAGNAMKEIPPEAMDKLFVEFRRIKKHYGRWDLVEIQGSDGKQVSITL